MQDEKINKAGTSSNSDSLKNMDEQSGKPTDGSQAYLDTDSAAAESAHGTEEKKENNQREEKKNK